MPLVKANNEVVALKHEKKLEVLDKVFLIFRYDEFHQLLKPVKARKMYHCQLTGNVIHPGDYCYPCSINPLRLNVNGTEKVLIEAALKEGDGILPKGFYSLQLPTTEDLINRKELLETEMQRRKELEKAATALLREGRENGR